MRAQRFWIAIVLIPAATLASACRVAAQLQPNEADVNAARSTNLPPLERESRESSPEKSVLVGRGYLGVLLDPEVADAAVVASVAQGGAAEQAGLKPGDTIEAVNGIPLESPRDLLDAIAELQAGDIVDIDFSRRITGRTQAVLAGSAGERSLLTTPDRRPPARSGVDQASYEDLPSQAASRDRPPAYARDRELRTAPRQIEPRSRAGYETNDAGAERNDDGRRVRSRERDREPPPRRRFLRWRR